MAQGVWMEQERMSIALSVWKRATDVFVRVASISGNWVLLWPLVRVNITLSTCRRQSRKCRNESVTKTSILLFLFIIKR